MSRLYPQGGSREGGTRVTVWGPGFADLGGAAGNGLRCKFGDAALVPASLASDGERLHCTSPPLEAEQCETVDVRVSLNGVALSDDAVDFTYHESERGVSGVTLTHRWFAAQDFVTL